MMLMRSGLLDLQESPAAMRKSQGKAALSKFMRFQAVANSNGIRLVLFHRRIWSDAELRCRKLTDKLITLLALILAVTDLVPAIRAVSRFLKK